jgi:hypothetical protein
MHANISMTFSSREGIYHSACKLCKGFTHSLCSVPEGRLSSAPTVDAQSRTQCSTNSEGDRLRDFYGEHSHRHLRLEMHSLRLARACGTLSCVKRGPCRRRPIRLVLAAPFPLPGDRWSWPVAGREESASTLVKEGSALLRCFPAQVDEEWVSRRELSTSAARSPACSVALVLRDARIWRSPSHAGPLHAKRFCRFCRFMPGPFRKDLARYQPANGNPYSEPSTYGSCKPAFRVSTIDPPFGCHFCNQLFQLT